MRKSATIRRSPRSDLAAALSDTPPSQRTVQRAAGMTVTETTPHGCWQVTDGGHSHTVQLGGNGAACDCTAALNNLVCSHVVAVITRTGWTPTRPAVTVPADPFQGIA